MHTVRNYIKNDSTVERIKPKGVGSNELSGDASPIATSDHGDFGLNGRHFIVGDCGMNVILKRRSH